ncbi:IucA/IucC family protein [Tsukamurella ocularis]|uniref:IucA/IucC family protein n=1 Tax=Tsukamurella ocularis TaxID=1970234 RepID=UPI0021699B11|nr:IucA/IucC family protein [Tsukamurella ocularis]MCS3780420.1 siderophore synthetase component [Tsukamurella ocularis]MCS3786025.1 siderophore synthetase component [Tsukamurella ocularis]MCS3849389.1 siderophore synthetase component [Tsukamurella ocularis]
MARRPAAEQITLDLIDVLIRENLFSTADRLAETPSADPDTHEIACRIPLIEGELHFVGRPGGALQAVRASSTPVWIHDDRRTPLTDPGRVLELVAAAADAPALVEVVADLRLAVSHAERMHAGWRHLAPDTAGPALLTGERIASLRNRPFHPTAHAVSGWDSAEVDRFGPMREQPLAMGWIGVRRARLRTGSAAESSALEALLLNGAERTALGNAMAASGVDLAEYQPVPIHPWQRDNALARHFGPELGARDIVVLPLDSGRFCPTSSLRSLIASDDPNIHLKVPIEVATLGSTRLLPAQYLDNGERGQKLLHLLRDRSNILGDIVDLCDERTWCGWNDPDEFARRPGLLSAQVRRYPPTADDEVTLPMSGFAAWGWDSLRPHLLTANFDPADPLRLFEELVAGFWTMALEFANFGAMPELHGQNVLVVLGGGRVKRFVLRDHDTVRIVPEALKRAGIPDPEYRIPDGVPQSLRLESAERLLSYLQTLGVQVNLYGIADSLADEFGIPESAFWRILERTLRGSLESGTVCTTVADTMRELFLDRQTWPSRQIFGPLLQRGRSTEASMPASVGRVPNPLTTAESHA